MKDKKVNLGDKVKDPVTGFTGIAVARTRWLHGCDRIVVQKSGQDKDGKPHETVSVDEPQPQIVRRGAVKSTNPSDMEEEVDNTGGPMPVVGIRPATRR